MAATLDSSPSAVTCPKCGKSMPGDASFCPGCGADVRGLGDANETLDGPQRTGRPGVATPEASGPELGLVVDGRYRLKEKLGEGGMGSVYKVEHVHMGKVLALKLMRPEAALEPEALARFRQEARIVSRLSHANTVSVFDFGELPDGALFMAMEYVPGRDLAALLRTEGALSERRAVPIVMQVLRSLAEAHDAGIVHRDIKPGNVMLMRTREGEDFAKVVDFGIAKLAEARRGGDRGSITARTDFVGTPNYMSPEQVKGEPLDGRSDLYSVGALLFELLTGRPPFVGENPLQVASKHLTEKPPALAEASPRATFTPALEEVVARALAKNPKERFKSADAFRDALDKARSPDARTGNTGKLPSWDRVEHTTGGQEIAQRADFRKIARFERNLRIQRTVLPIAVVLGIAGAGAIGYRYLNERQAKRPHEPVTVEVEPNDGPRDANLVLPGTDVQGYIKRPARDRNDQDLYEFEVPGPQRQRADIRVSGVPNVNLALKLHPLSAEKEGSSGPRSLKVLAFADDAFLGAGEALTDLPLEPGRYLVHVADKQRADESGPSTRENTLDPYTLRVDLAPWDPFGEAEPNDTLETAMKVEGNAPVFGHAGHRGEAVKITTAAGELVSTADLFSDDYFEVTPTSGATTACALLTGVKGATTSLFLAANARPASLDKRGLTEQLARHAREKPVRVGAGDVAVRCAKATEALVFRSRVEEGSSDAPYAFVPLDDGKEGTAALLGACKTLGKAHRSECAALVKAACGAVEKSFGGDDALRQAIAGIAARFDVPSCAAE